MKDRIKETLKKIIAILGIGYLYLLLYKNEIFQLHCPIRSATGFLCPGCGISQMLCALHDLNFIAAWNYNPVAFICLPILLILGAQITHKYICTGSRKVSQGKNFILWGIVAAFAIYGIIRNF